ncbi:hypothetical protein E2C01_047866 [Portunus trituberculatus]|uniref:Uncharacterized protein n=1 Tax=Portunus trituberculatus TaxID=210409 RepID=A0A5B7G266_PORTR|nr:hypothetical protein [Portunus trituberculatus]
MGVGWEEWWMQYLPPCKHHVLVGKEGTRRPSAEVRPAALFDLPDSHYLHRCLVFHFLIGTVSAPCLPDVTFTQTQHTISRLGNISH